MSDIQHMVVFHLFFTPIFMYSFTLFFSNLNRLTTGYIKKKGSDYVTVLYLSVVTHLAKFKSEL